MNCIIFRTGLEQTNALFSRRGSSKVPSVWTQCCLANCRLVHLIVWPEQHRKCFYHNLRALLCHHFLSLEFLVFRTKRRGKKNQSSLITPSQGFHHQGSFNLLQLGGYKNDSLDYSVVVWPPPLYRLKTCTVEWEQPPCSHNQMRKLIGVEWFVSRTTSRLGWEEVV